MCNVTVGCAIGPSGALAWVWCQEGVLNSKGSILHGKIRITKSKLGIKTQLSHKLNKSTSHLGFWSLLGHKGCYTDLRFSLYIGATFVWATHVEWYGPFSLAQPEWQPSNCRNEHRDPGKVFWFQAFWMWPVIIQCASLVCRAVCMKARDRSCWTAIPFSIENQRILDDPTG